MSECYLGLYKICVNIIAQFALTTCGCWAAPGNAHALGRSRGRSGFGGFGGVGGHMAMMAMMLAGGGGGNYGGGGGGYGSDDY